MSFIIYKTYLLALLVHTAIPAPPGSSESEENPPNSLASSLKTFAFEDLVPVKPQFHPARIQGQWLSEKEYLYSSPVMGEMKKHNVETNTDEVFLSTNSLKRMQFPVAWIGKNGEYILFITEAAKVNRYSTTGKYFLYEEKSGESWPLADGQTIQTVAWTEGDKRALAYVRKNNVYYVSEFNKALTAVQLTSSGVPGEVYHGAPDWIYEEEVFASPTAMWFSKQGSYLAVASFNDTLVQSASYPVYGPPLSAEFQYPYLVEFKYPKTGLTNPVVSLNVFPLSSTWLETKPIVNIPAPVQYVGFDYILTNVKWATDQHLVVVWMNRRQNVSVLLHCDVVVASCQNKRVQTERNGWIDINDMLFDDTGNLMVTIAPRPHGADRFNHVVRRSFLDGQTVDLSPGNMTVKSIDGWNYKTDTVFFIGSTLDEPWVSHLWSNTQGLLKCETCGEARCKNVAVDFAPGAKNAVVSCSSSNQAPVHFMYQFEQKNKFTVWQNNTNLRNTLANYNLPVSKFFKAKLASNNVAHIHLRLPPNMDKERKYPMLLKVYAGPTSSIVMDNYDLDYTTYLVTNRSVIACYVDVRGSGAMGLNAQFAVNNALGTVEVEDTLEAVKYLTSRFSYIDGSRVGVWGWSYGGYTAAMMLARDTDRVLACAAAVAPVTSWLYYDTIYTERYMDVPSKNQAGYERSDLLLQAPKLRGRKFLLVHGNADDNVHYQHSMMLSKILQNNDIAFQQMSYPDESHSLSGVSRHLYHTLDRYWTDCLVLLSF